VQTSLLKNYAILNYTAISKILKKHDKLIPSFPTKDIFMQEHVAPKKMYSTQDDVNRVLTQIKNIYGDFFEDGNRKKAEEILEDAAKLGNHFFSFSFLSFSSSVCLAIVRRVSPFIRCSIEGEQRTRGNFDEKVLPD